MSRMVVGQEVVKFDEHLLCSAFYLQVITIQAQLLCLHLFTLTNKTGIELRWTNFRIIYLVEFTVLHRDIRNQARSSSSSNRQRS
jgi:hypothetical protein